ncbi:MAG: response regulator [Desulfuromonadales bacterium]|nr:response regulator [Desulfuromonadales bacterium]
MNRTEPGLRVLYLEDNPVDADLTRREMARLAPEMALEIVQTLAAARERLDSPSPPFDLVLTDLRLPDGSGLELLSHPGQGGQQLPVVILTGSGDQEEAVAALKAGAEDYLVKKPAHLADLPRVLTDSHRRFRERRERRSRPLRVLYAEPNPFDVDLTRRHLAQQAPHIHFEMAGSGGEVLARLAQTSGTPLPHDVLLLDYRLPGLNALEVVKALRQEHRSQIPIVLVTGQGNEEVAVQALRLGVNDYLVKREGYLQRLPVVLENVHRQAELNQAEARYRNLFASMRDAIIIADLSRTIIEVNQPALRTLFGYETSEVLGQSTRILYADPEEYEQTGREIFNRRDAAGGKLLEVQFRRKSGEAFTAELSALKLRGDQGEPAGNIGIIRDITERKQKEQQLVEKNAELERFTYAVSHDLKSPLVTIKTFMGFLQQDLAAHDSEKIQKSMNYILTAADTMEKLLDELLQLSRVGRVINPPVPVSFRDLVDEALSTVAGSIAVRQVTIAVADGDVTLNGDRPRLVEIWQNLIDNAVKYMGGQKAPLIEIGIEADDDGPVFYVRDNGMGIEPPGQEKVFGLFEKLDASSKGTGMGLALVKRIVELYHGRIWFESAGRNRGVCFRFTLPQALTPSGEKPLE